MQMASIFYEDNIERSKKNDSTKQNKLDKSRIKL